MLNTPFSLGLALRLGLADAIADGLAVAVALGAADTLPEALAVLPAQPETASATIQLASSRFVARKGSLLDMHIANLT